MSPGRCGGRARQGPGRRDSCATPCRARTDRAVPRRTSTPTPVRLVALGRARLRVRSLLAVAALGLTGIDRGARWYVPVVLRRVGFSCLPASSASSASSLAISPPTFRYPSPGGRVSAREEQRNEEATSGVADGRSREAGRQGRVYQGNRPRPARQRGLADHHVAGPDRLTDQGGLSLAPDPGPSLFAPSQGWLSRLVPGIRRDS